VKWFILFVGVVFVCFLAALILGLAGGGLGRGTTSLGHEPLPEDPIDDADFDDLVFDVGLRGYRMVQVDGVVDRLRRELREKDEQIAVLRRELGVEAELDQTAPRERAPDEGDTVEAATGESDPAEAEDGLDAGEHREAEPTATRDSSA
jgi:hypothetical protein